MGWTIGPYNSNAVFSGLYQISFLPADIQFAFPLGKVLMFPWCSQLKFYRQARFSFHAKLHNHLLQISPSPLLPSLYKILLQFCILQYINARELMCIKIKFGGFVLDMICHLTSGSNTHKQGAKWFLQENRHGKSNHTLLFAALVGIRLLKVKLNTKSSLFCWWQESIKPAAAFWCHPPSHPVPFDQGIVA